MLIEISKFGAGFYREFSHRIFIFKEYNQVEENLSEKKKSNWTSFSWRILKKLEKKMIAHHSKKKKNLIKIYNIKIV